MNTIYGDNYLTNSTTNEQPQAELGEIRIDWKSEDRDLFSAHPFSTAPHLRPAKSKLIRDLPSKLHSTTEPWLPDEKYHTPLPDQDPFVRIRDRMKKHDNSICEVWKDEIEKLLIFAALFSATLTAFVVESYRWLQEDYAQTSAHLLAQLSLQVNAIANNVNMTLPVHQKQASFTPDAKSVRINIFWFLSLVLCLSTVIVGILCFQWLREFLRQQPLSDRDAIIHRQMRFEGLIAWRVPEIVWTLPVILQLSVFLFFAGILDLLWSLHYVVATVISLGMGLTMSFVAFTTVAPLLQDVIKKSPPLFQCPYKSPLSWFFSKFMIIPFQLLTFSKGQSYLGDSFGGRSWLQRDKRLQAARVKFQSESRKSQIKSYDIHFLPTYDTEALVMAFRWVQNNIGHTQDILNCLHSLQYVAAGEIVSQLSPSKNRFPDNRGLERDLAMLRYMDLFQERDLSPLYHEIRVRCLNGAQQALSKKPLVLGEVLETSTLLSTPLDLQLEDDRKLEITLHKILSVAILENSQLKNTLTIRQRLETMIRLWHEEFLSSPVYIRVPITKSNLAQHKDIQQLSLFIIGRIKELTNRLVPVACSLYSNNENASATIGLTDGATSGHMVKHVQELFISVVSPPSAGELSPLKQLASWEERLHAETAIGPPTPLTDAIVGFVKGTLVQSTVAHVSGCLDGGYHHPKILRQGPEELERILFREGYSTPAIEP